MKDWTRYVCAGILGTCFCLSMGIIANAEEPVAKKTEVKTQEKEGDTANKEAVAATPEIEVVFVLDTTGSMGGLIEGAKQKIWSIANQMATAKPTPNIKIGLVGYRDRGDKYITKITPLTEDLDAVYNDLLAFKADGGGDGPESVNQALNEAVTKIKWSEDEKTFKVIFLVGDAPAHLDYEQDVHYKVSCELGVRKNIIINTIQCGNQSGTRSQWTEIAHLGEGEYVQIDQSGGMRVVSSPYDKKIAEANTKLNKLIVSYGPEEQRARVKQSQKNAMNAPASSNTSRNAYLEKRKEAQLAEGEAQDEAAVDLVTSRGDLVADLGNDRVKFEDIKQEDLPKELQGKSKEEIETFIAKNMEQRKALQTELTELNKKRQAHIQAEEKKLNQDKKDGFDEKVKQIIKKQAAKKNLNYDK